MTNSKLLGLIVIAITMTTSVAYAEVDGIGFSVPPDFPDPRTTSSVQLDYQDGYLVVTRVHENSVIDLVRNGITVTANSDNDKFAPSRNGCYLVEERTESTWQRSNEVCDKIVQTKWSDYVDERTTIQLKNDITLIVLPHQTDMKSLSACPSSYSEYLVSCYRKGGYEDENKQFIISSWETITPFAIEHELKHADCDCNFHEQTK